MVITPGKSGPSPIASKRADFAVEAKIETIELHLFG